MGKGGAEASPEELDCRARAKSTVHLYSAVTTRAPSLPPSCPRPHLTVEMMITRRSWPWNSSTLPTCGDPNPRNQNQ